MSKDQPAIRPRRRRRAGVTLAVIGAVVVVLLIIAHSGPARGWVAGKVRAFLADEYHLDARIGQLDYSLLGLRADLTEVSLRRDEDGAVAFLEVDRVHADLSWRTLLGGLSVEAIEVESPRLTVRRSAAGASNLPQLPASEATPSVPGEPFELVVARLAVRDVAVDVHDASSELDVQLRGLAVTGGSDAEGTLRAELSLGEQVEVKLGDGVASIDRLAGVLGLDQTVARIDGLEIDSSVGRLELSVRAGFAGGDRTIGGDVVGTLDVAGLAALVLAGVEGAGSVTLAGDLDGSLDAPRGGFRVAGRGLGLGGLQDVFLAGEAVVTPEALSLEAVEARLAGGTVSASGGLELAGGPGDGHLDFVAGGLDLAALVAVTGEEVPALAGSKLAASGRGAIRSRDLATLDLTLDGETTATDEGVGLAGTLRLRVAEGSWSLDLDEELGESMSIHGRASGNLDPEDLKASTVSGQLRAAGDLAAIEDVVAQLEPDAPEAEYRVGGDASAEISLGGTFAAPVFSGTLRADRLVLGSLDEGTAGARFELQDSVAKLSDLALQLGPLAVSGQARLDLAGEHVAAELKTRVGDLGELTADLPKPIEGGLTIDASIDGPFDGARAVLTIAGERIRVAGVEHPVDSRLELALGKSLDHTSGGGELTIAGVRWGDEVADVRVDLALADGSLDLTFAGLPADASARASVALGEPYAFTVDAGVDHPRALAGFAVHGLAGGASVSLSAAGSLSGPSLDSAAIDLRAVEATFDGEALRLEQPASVVLARERLDVNDLALRFGGLRVAGSGRLTRGGERALSMRAEGDLAALQPLLDRVAGDTPIELSGDLAADIELRGLGDSLRLESKIDTSDARVTRGEAVLEDIDVNLAVSDGVVRLSQLSARLGPGRIELEAEVPMALLQRPGDAATVPAATPAELRGRLTGVDRQVVQDLLGVELPEGVEVALAASFELAATALDPAHVRGQFRLDQADLSLGEEAFRQERPGTVSLADGRVEVSDLRWRSGDDHLGLEGRIDVAGEAPRLELHLAGDAGLGLFGAVLPGVATGGRATIDLRASGAVAEPLVRGELSLSDGALQLRKPRLGVGDLNGTVVIDGDRLRVEGFTGMVGRGPLEIEGELRLDGRKPVGGAIKASVRDLELQLIEGFHNELRASITFSAEGEPTIGGEVVVVSAEYREAFTVLRLVGALGGDRDLAGRADKRAPAPSWLNDLRLDFAVKTEEEVFIDNNYGTLHVGVDLRAVGSLGRPALEGAVEIRRGSELSLAGRDFTVEHATVSFDGSPSLRPEVQVLVTAELSGVEAMLIASGRAPELRVTVASDPPLPEQDILSLLTTGQKAAREGESVSTASSGKLSTAYLTEDVWGFAGQKLGVDRVSIGEGTATDDSLLVIGGSEPTLRLTVTKSFGRWFELVLSQALREGSDLTTILIYRPWKSVSVSAGSYDDNSRTIDLRHQLAWGGDRTGDEISEVAERVRPKVSEVRFAAPPGVDVAALRKKLKLKPGKRFDFSRWRRDMDRMAEVLHDGGQFEARIRGQREATGEGGDATMLLTYSVEPGPPTQLSVVGADDRALRDALLDTWRSAIASDFLSDDLADSAREWLREDGYLAGDAACEVATIEGRKSATLTVTPGTKSRRFELRFSGNELFDAAALTAALEPLQRRPWTEPARAASWIARLYRKRGYMAARVSPGEIVVEGERAILPFAISEGLAFRVRSARIAGGGRPDALAAAGVSAGSAYTPDLDGKVQSRVEAHLLKLGYNRAWVTVGRVLDHADAVVDFDLSIVEGPRQVLSEVAFEGGKNTNRDLIERSLVGLAPGDPADLDQLHEAQRKLYGSGVFREVQLEVEPDGAAVDAGDQPVKARFRLHEASRWRLKYGVQVFDPAEAGDVGDELRPGVLAELRRQNLFGRGWSAGVGGSYLFGERPGAVDPSDGDETRIESVRGQLRGQLAVSLDIPRFFGAPIKSTLLASVRNEESGSLGDLRADETVYSVGLQQHYRFGFGVDVNYGYVFEQHRVSNFQLEPEGPILDDFRFRLARLRATALRDARDDPMNPTEGYFASANVELAGAFLGSEIDFVKGLGKLFYHKSLGPIVLAGGARIGIGETFADTDFLPPADRFFAGGPTTVRGYRQDSLGPLTAEKLAVGGEALLVFNGEVRFPLLWWFGGVGFVDAGNAFASLSDLDFGEMAVSAGAGLRLDTPIALFRLDYGVPITDDQGVEDRWTFSIGHAF